MGSLIEVRRWCDNPFVHDPDGEKVFDAQQCLLAVDLKLYTADLCDPCDDGLTRAQARQMIKDRIAKPYTPEGGAAAKAGRRRIDTVPSVKAATAPSAQLSGKRRGRAPSNGEMHACIWCPLTYARSSGTGFRTHLRKIHGFATSEEAFGSQCPVCGQADLQKISGHVVAKHPEFAHITDAFLWARDHGDEHGVFAARRVAGENVQELVA